MKRPGRLVQTKTGLKGIIYNDEKPVKVGAESKLVVHVLNQDMTPAISSINGKQRKLLVKPANLKVIGFTD